MEKDKTKTLEIKDCYCEQPHCGKPLFMLSDLDIDVNEETSTRYYQLACLKCGARHAKHESSQSALLTFELLISKTQVFESEIKKVVMAYDELEKENEKVKDAYLKLNETYHKTERRNDILKTELYAEKRLATELSNILSGALNQ